VINAGDGAREHPTQTLCDLYTLYREHGRVEGLTVTLFGDLKYGRTVHSLAYGLALFGARIILAPGDPALMPPADLLERLRAEYDCTPEWWDPNGEAPLPPCDALYLTRMQRERLGEGAGPRGYPRVDRAQLRRWGVGEQTTLLHPLPRAGELDPELDGEARSAYFRQAANGVPVRMATLALLLGIAEEEWSSGWSTRANGAAHGDDATPSAGTDVRASGIACSNPSCVANREPAVAPRFIVAGGEEQAVSLRCRYCEQPLHAADTGDHTANTYRTADDSELAALLAGAPPEDTFTAGYLMPERGGVANYTLLSGSAK
jgi:hypothetical protein